MFSSLLSSPHIFWALLTSTQLISALVSSSHLISALLSALSNHLTFFSGPKPALKTDLGAKASNPYAFHREDLTQRSSYTQQAFAQRSLYAQKLLHGIREAFIHSKLFHKASFCAQKAFTRKSLHTSLYTEKPLHGEASTHSKLWHKEAPTQKSFYTQKTFIYTQKLLHKEAFAQLLHTEAFTQLLHTASLHAEKL